ncbi:hypothetical protein, partial [[Clostridium] symbiosum]|uniref:hypothetical protein n=1 Tax=Clostridium symbiosum TaxID=1512 RepID=UPI001D074E97
CPDFPPATTDLPGLKTHTRPLTIPPPDRPGGVLIPQHKSSIFFLVFCEFLENFNRLRVLKSRKI